VRNFGGGNFLLMKGPPEAAHAHSYTASGVPGNKATHAPFVQAAPKNQVPENKQNSLAERLLQIREKKATAARKSNSEWAREMAGRMGYTEQEWRDHFNREYPETR
jgi:hypothetical protein